MSLDLHYDTRGIELRFRAHHQKSFPFQWLKDEVDPLVAQSECVELSEPALPSPEYLADLLELQVEIACLVVGVVRLEVRPHPTGYDVLAVIDGDEAYPRVYAKELVYEFLEGLPL